MEEQRKALSKFMGYWLVKTDSLLCMKGGIEIFEL